MAINFLNNGYFAGKVGIGVETPLTTLHLYDTGGSILRLASDAHTDNNKIEFDALNNGTIYHSIVSNTNSGNLQIRAGDNGSGHEVNVYTDGLFVATFSQDQKLGVGTASPLKKLSINGGDVAVNNGNSFIVGAAITGNTQIGELGADSGQLQLLTESTRDIKFGSTTYGNIMFLEGTNGNVGIGTLNPSGKLDIAYTGTGGTGTQGIGEGLNISSFTPNITFNDNSSNVSNYAIHLNQNVFTLGTYTSATSQSPDLVLVGGRVGIGTNDPTNTDYGSVNPKLHVYTPGTSGAFDLVARFQAGNDSNDTGGAILINHSNDRGILIEGGRGGAGTVPDDDAVGHLGLVRSNGAHTRILTLKEKSATNSSLYGVGIGTTAPQTFLDVSGQGNRAGGNIIVGAQGDGSGKFSQICGTHYNAATEPEGISMIGIYSNSTNNSVHIGGNIYESNPATDINFWTHTATTHAQGGTKRMIINSAGAIRFNAYGAGTLVTDASGNITASSGGGAGGPYLPLSAGSSFPLTGDLYQTMGAIGVAQTDQDYLAKIYELNSDGFMSLYTGQPTPLERIRISSYGDSFFVPANNGNVGIGTTSPSTKLTISASNSGAANNNTLRFVDTDVTTQANQSFGKIEFETKDTNNPGVNAFINAFAEGTGGTGALSFGTGSGGSTEKMRITSGGNVGIGTTSPSVPLAVEGVASMGSNSRLSMGILDINSNGTPTQILIQTTIPFNSGSADFTVNIKGFIYGTDESCNLSIHWHYYNSVPYNANITSSGSWAPIANLHSSSSGFVQIHLLSPGYWPKIYVESMYSSAYNDLYASGWSWSDAAGTGTAYALDYNKDFGNNFVMTDPGNVGIGTASPTANLHVQGNSATDVPIIRSGGFGNSGSTLELAETLVSGNMTYGFSFEQTGNGTNELLIKRHNNSASGAPVITLSRTNNNVSMSGGLSLALKATSSSTLSTDGGTTLTTKNYVDALTPGAGVFLPLAGGTMANTNLVTNMNADLLDGLQATSFLRSDAADTSTGEILFDAGFKSDSILLSGAQNFDNISRSGFYNLYNTNTGSTSSPGFDYGTMIVVGGNKQSTTFGLQIAHERTGAGMYVRGMNDNSTWYAWDEIWNSGNDGAGSGLDADLLDGQQGSYYVNTGTAQSIAGVKSFSGKIGADGGIDGLTLANGGINGSNYDIRGVNQLVISDPGEGIVFTGTATMYLNAVDDATDSILKLTNATQLNLNSTARITNLVDPSGAQDAATKNYVDTEVGNIPSGLAFEGNWNASTDTPTLAGTTQDNGKFWIVSVAGSTNLSGITDWAVGDWAIYVDNGAGTDAWQKVDNSSSLAGAGSAGKVTFWSSTSNVSFNNNFTYDGTYLTSPRIQVGDGTDGYFWSDTAGRTAFAAGDFYIQNTVTNYFNYATNMYLGDATGDTVLFRGSTITGTSWGITPAGVATFADLLTVNGDGHLFLGADGETPKIDMMYDDHASGAGWDTRIFTGKTDDLPNGQSFPTSTIAGGYGTQYQANSDGAFFGIIPYTAGHFRPVINWGDDVADSPFSFQFNGVDKATVSSTGVITSLGGSSTEWNTAYDNSITTFTDSGTSTVTLTLTQQDGGTLSTSFSNPQGTVTGTGSSGRVAFWNGTSAIASSSNLYWDNGTAELGIGTSSPTTSFTIASGHGTTRANLYYNGSINAYNAYIDMWASEPGVSYNGSGIGANINGSPYYGRKVTEQGQTYIRFIDGQFEVFTGTNSSGTGSTAAKRFQITDSGLATFYQVPVVGTMATSDNSTKAASTAYVTTAVATGVGNYLPLAGGRMTTTAKIEFYNASQYIHANSTNDLTIASGDDINFQTNYARFFNAGVESARISATTNSWIANGSNSKLGVNRTDPSFNLDVEGTFRTTGAATIEGNLEVGGASLQLTGTSYNNITSDANVDIGVSSSAHNVVGYTTLLYAGSPTAGTTNNIAGGHLYLAGGAGKGTGAGGDIIFRVAPVGSSGSTVNAYTTALTISDDKSATFGGNIIAGGAVYPATSASASLGLSNKQWAGLDLSSSSAITWGNGDAEIIEGETNNYSLTFKTYDGTSNSAALRLDGDNTATFTGDLIVSGDSITRSKTRGLGTNYATSEGWVAGAAGSFSSRTGYFGGNFNNNGATAENKVVYDIGPFGSRELVWMTVPETVSNADGGWNKSLDGFNNSANNGFMSIVYVRRDAGSAAGNFYHGCSGSNTLNLSGVVDTNPYFSATGIGVLPADVWCVAIGIIHATNDTTTTTSALGGIYRLDTGEKIQNATTYRQKTSNAAQEQRVYHYYSTSTTAQLDFANPGWYILDGSEPSLGEILGSNKGDFLPLAGGTMTGTAGVVFPDNFNLKIGTGSDLKIFHNATDSFIVNEVGDLKITQGANDKDIVFESDNGSGGTTEYLRINGQYEQVYLRKDMQVSDGKKIMFGDSVQQSGDLQIYHDGTNSFIETSTSSTGDLYIKAQGTGNELVLQATDDILIRPQGGENGITVIGNGEVRIYHDNVLQLATTSTGISTNTIDATVSAGSAGNFVVMDGTRLASRTAAQVLSDIGAGTGTVTGTGSSGRIAFWDGTSSISSDSGFTFASADDSITCGAVKVGVGSVSAPSLTFNSDTNTGIYSPNSDMVYVAGGGANLFSITSNGISVNNMVAMGSAASVFLTRNGNRIESRTAAQVLSDIGGTSSSGVTSIATTAPILGGTITSTGTISLKTPASGDWFNGGAIVIGSDGLIEVGRYIDFHNSNTGTTDFDARLDCYSAGNLQLTGNFKSTGNVLCEGLGVGINPPREAIEVYGSSKNIAITNTAETDAGIIFRDSGGIATQAAAIKFNSGDQKLKFFVNDETAQRMVIDTSGNVGIGTTGPDVKFHVTENEDGSGLDKGTAKFINTNTGQGATTMHMVQTSSSNFANAVKFWQGSTPTAVGFIRLTTSATQFITSASDLNLKKNITNWSDDTLSKFKALEPKKFRFKTQDVSEDKTLGFIAQNEVDNFPEAYPQFLGDDEKPYYGFNPSGMVPHLMKAIKDLVEKVETLENKITQLENNN